MIWTCAWGDPAYMMYASVVLCLVDSPFFVSNGHGIIQCGPTEISGLVGVIGIGIASLSGADTGRTGNRIARVSSRGLYS